MNTILQLDADKIVNLIISSGKTVHATEGLAVRLFPCDSKSFVVKFIEEISAEGKGFEGLMIVPQSTETLQFIRGILNIFDVPQSKVVVVGLSRVNSPANYFDPAYYSYLCSYRMFELTDLYVSNDVQVLEELVTEESKIETADQDLSDEDLIMDSSIMGNSNIH